MDKLSTRKTVLDARKRHGVPKRQHPVFLLMSTTMEKDADGFYNPGISLSSPLFLSHSHMNPPVEPAPETKDKPAEEVAKDGETKTSEWLVAARVR